jgi:hypothetical protein
LSYVVIVMQFVTHPAHTMITTVDGNLPSERHTNLIQVVAAAAGRGAVSNQDRAAQHADQHHLEVSAVATTADIAGDRGIFCRARPSTTAQDQSINPRSSRSPMSHWARAASRVTSSTGNRDPAELDLGGGT